MSGIDDRTMRRNQMAERMGEMKEKLKPYFYALLILLVIGMIWYSYDQFFSYAGVTNVITIEIKNVEVTQRYGEHTLIWGNHAYGDRVFKYTLVGRHDLDIGSVYRITYVNRVRILPLSLRITLWGEVISIEEIQ